MVGMRAFTVLLVALLIGSGVLPAMALSDDPSPTSSTSPSADCPSGSASPSPSDSASPSPSPSDCPSPTPSQSPSPEPVPAVYPVFNYPTPGNPDPAINGELTRLINEVPATGQISAALFVVAPNYPVVDALISAHNRGASVRVVMDSGQGQSAATAAQVAETIAKLSAVLGTDPSQRSYLVQCVNACISKTTDSINHNKYVVMSETGALQDVVFQSTANVRSDGSGDGAWNAATVSSGSPGVYDSYLTYFANLSARITVPDNDYNAVQPPVQLGRWKPYYFPRTDGVDSVSQTLTNVNCAAAPTRIDVMAAFFTRPKVRNRLNEMAAAGCVVRVIARTDSITREFCDSLKSPVEVKISDKPSQTKVGIHSKYILISGGFEGTVRKTVWMGSENLTRNALVRNDETFLLIDDDALHAAFVENFARIWNEPSLTAGCGRAGGVSEEQIEEEADQETTPLIKEQQQVKRKLPKKLKKRTELKSTRTVQGQPLTTAVKCRVTGTSQKVKKRKICALKKAQTNPTIVLSPKKKQKLKVQIVQKANGSATLEKFSRQAKYSYRR